MLNQIILLCKINLVNQERKIYIHFYRDKSQNNL